MFWEIQNEITIHLKKETLPIKVCFYFTKRAQEILKLLAEDLLNKKNESQLQISANRIASVKGLVNNI